jgi:hypothetical protein
LCLKILIFYWKIFKFLLILIWSHSENSIFCTVQKKNFEICLYFLNLHTSSYLKLPKKHFLEKIFFDLAFHLPNNSAPVNYFSFYYASYTLSQYANDNLDQILLSIEPASYSYDKTFTPSKSNNIIHDQYKGCIL